jgi:hypothetical protein
MGEVRIVLTEPTAITSVDVWVRIRKIEETLESY